MHQTGSHSTENHTPGFLSGGGSLGEHIRAYNWGSTPLGAVEHWPQSLRSALSICLNSNFPIAIYWGADLTLLYNEAWSPIPGDKHPWALGKSAKEVWPEIWSAIEPQFQKAFDGVPGGSKDALLPMHRHGYTEECYFDFTFTPIYGEGGKVEGVFNAVIETTKTILNERQLKTLRALGNADPAATNIDEVFTLAAQALEENNKDFPFGIIYKIHSGQDEAVPIAYVGLEQNQGFFPSIIQLDGSTEGTADFYQAYTTNQLVVAENKGQQKNLPTGGWDKQPTHFLHLPIAGNNRQIPEAIFSTALNPFRQFDETYQQFAQLVADQVSTEVNNMVAYEEEKRRALALAEIDKAKTAFFTNISHEFRTPLTLILGTVEGLLQEKDSSSADLERLAVTHRNAVRLLKLVNALLDFSRLEAGRVNAVFQPTNISEFTENIAANFRSAIEKAGLKFEVRCEDINTPVYIDREMWEKIVLNLLSNAFKYTLEGAVYLALTLEDNTVVLKITDTGVGIPAADLPRIFERFHRVQSTLGRSFEGSGIGLALVHELVHLHGGSIAVESQEGRGSEFTIVIPLGFEHLPETQVVDDSAFEHNGMEAAFLEEAAVLINDETTNDLLTSNELPVVLVVDDNADMRRYIKNLLQQQFAVVTATNGEEALQKIEEVKPALVVSDIMMPVMDGVQLLQAIKGNPQTATVPVILVSARAGDEARMEGFEIGADDYLLKPFSGKELLARVRSQLNLTRKREAALQSIYRLFDEVPFSVAALRGEALEIDFINQHNLDLWEMKKEEVIGKPLFEVRPDIRADAEHLHREVYRTGKRFVANEIPVSIIISGVKQQRYFNSAIDPLFDETGNIIGQLATTIEVTDSVLLRQKVEESEAKLFRFLMQAPAAIAVLEGSDHQFVLANDRYQKMFGRSEEQLLQKSVLQAFPESEGQGFHDLLNEIYRSEMPRAIPELPATLNVNGHQTAHYYDTNFQPIRNEKGDITRIMAMVIDVTESVAARKKIEESEKRFRSLANAMPQVVWIGEPNGEVSYYNNQVESFDGAKKMADGNWSWQGMVHPEDIEPTNFAWQYSVANGTTYQQEQRVRMKDGNYRWHLSRALPQKDDAGKVVKWFGTATDVHDQKTLSVQLEQLVAERTKELERSNEDLQQFAHVASHDLKEPVRKVMTFTNRLKNELGITISEKAYLYLSKIESSTLRMYSMIDGVLLYSSLNALEQTKELVDLEELIQHIENDLEIAINEKDATISYEGLPGIEGSSILLYQLFYNLLNNSLKFSHVARKPLIRIDAAVAITEEIKAQQLKPGRTYIKLTLQDNGIGFRSQDSGKIFGTFIRLHSKDKYEGTGLGLSLCKKIVERHGGTIIADGELGEGATFSIFLPGL